MHSSLRPFITLGLLAIPVSAGAQSSFYLVTQRSQPYLALANGTVQAGIQFDSALTMPIGFSFRYFDESYDSIAIGENGVVSLQQSCAAARCEFDEFCNRANVCERGYISPPFSGLPTGNPPTRLIAPYYDDLYVDRSNPASEIRTALVGVAPNRELVVEWRNMRHAAMGGGTTAARFSFQLRLYEATGNVRFHYGPYTLGNDAQFWGGYVGIQAPFGVEFIPGLSCSAPPSRCSSTHLQVLGNQIIEIGRPNVPELTGSVAPLTGANPGQAARVQVVARNLGLQATATGFAADVYLSLATPAVPARDTLLGRVNFAALAAGGTATATLTRTIPGNLAIGNYYVSALFDADAVVAEATETNNLVLGDKLILVGADLAAVIDNLPSGQPGQPGTVEGRVVNASSAVTRIPWRMLLSLDTVPDASDALLASGQVDVSAGGETPIVANVSFPNLTVGYYQVLLVVDPTDVLPEVDELNNVGVSPSFILGPELGAAGVELPSRTGPGETVELFALIDSVGSALAEVPFRIWISADQRFSPASDLVIATGTTAVEAGAQARASVLATIPSSLAPGEYSLFLEVDPANRIVELDESNNVALSGPLQLSGPDIAAQDLQGPTLAFRGRLYRFTTRLENVGGQTVRDVYYSVHLSVNQLITVTDPQIFRGGPLSLAPGESVELTSTATIDPSFMRGQNYLGVIADSEGSVVELNEADNIRRQLTPVIVRDVAPDFVGVEVLAPELAAAGEVVTLQRQLENAGNAAGTAAYAVRLVPEGAADEDGVVIGRGMLTLALGTSATGVDRLEIPASVYAGRYRVDYVLDPDETVDELDETNNVVSADRTIELANAQLSIVTKVLPVGGVGVPYDVTLIAQGGLGPRSWRVVSGSLPAGLSLDADGRISGTPTADAQARFVVEVTDGRTTYSRELTLLVAAGQLELTLLTRSLPAAYVEQPYELELIALGGVPPYTWTYDGELPAGFTITSSGTLAGQASAPAASRVLNVYVNDARGDHAERPIAFRVLDGAEGVRFGDGGLPDGVVGDAYEATVVVSGGQPPYALSLGAGELPPGLRLEGGLLRGTPERAGTTTVELRVGDARGTFDLALFVIEVSAPGELRFVTTGLPAGQVGAPYADESGATVQLRVLTPADSSSVSVTVEGGALPAGLTLAPNGRITGTPTQAGVSAFVALVVDAQGRSARGAFGLSIAPTPTSIETDEQGGCDCTSTGSDGRGSLGALALIATLALALRRRALPALLVALAVGPGTAQAQADAGGRVAIRPPPPPIDAGVGPDGGGTVGPSLYFLSTRSEPYRERQGGPVISFPGIDDSSATVQLPFPFRLFETDYSSVSVGTNGLIAFAGDASSLGNSTFPNGDPFAPHGVIAAFWDDLFNPTVTTYVEGTSPNQVFIIQYAGVDRCCGGGRASLNFQIQLFEGAAGRIELHYGPDNGPGPENFDASIGFEDERGARGYNFVACTPACTQPDFTSLGGTVLVALMDAGEDVFANRIEPLVRGVGRVYQGVPFPVELDYSSYHGQPIGPFVYRVHLMTRSDAAPANPVYTSAPITLGPYDSRRETVDVTLPLSVAPGRYRLALEVDADQQLAEPSETNNVAIGTTEILVSARGADFTVGAVTPPPGPFAPGARLSLHAALQNRGNLEDDADYEVVLSANPAPTASDIRLAQGTVRLPLLTTVTATVEVQIPAVLAAGEYWIGVIVDPSDTVSELSEVNNIGASLAPVVIRGGPLSVLSAALPNAYVGLEYQARLVSDAIGDAIWTVSAGRLPDGLALAEYGELAGRPTAPGSSTFTVQVEANGERATRELTLEVRADPGPLVIVTRALLPAVVGEAYPPSEAGDPVEAQQHLVAVGGAGPVRFTVSDGALPDGVALDADGYLHGTATHTGRFVFTAEASDGAATASARLTLIVVDSGRLTLIPEELPPAELDRPYRAQLRAVGVADPSRLELRVAEGSALPDGITLDLDGTLTGTATRVGRYAFTVRATEALGASVLTDTASFELVVTAPAGFGVAPAMLPDATVGVAYRAVLEARQGRGPYTWATIEARRLPRGINARVVTEAGVEKLELAGTPEEIPTDPQLGDRTGGVAVFAVSVTDAAGRRAEAAYALRVLAPPPPPPVEADESGCSCGATAPASGAAEALLALALVGGVARRRRR